MAMPIRTCVGCGQRSPQHDMLRFRAIADGRLATVVGQVGRGRTAYLHRRPDCSKAFARSKLVSRSLRTTIALADREIFVRGLADPESRGQRRDDR